MLGDMIFFLSLSEQSKAIFGLFRLFVCLFVFSGAKQQRDERNVIWASDTLNW